MLVCMAALLGAGIAACSDANEYEDVNTDNPSWVDNYDETQDIPHPETIANTKWVRGSGLKVNAYGEEVQGFVESLDFVMEDSVVVKVSEEATVNDSNNEDLPYYEYEYSEVTGTLRILKEVVDDKGKKSKTPIITGVVVSGKQEIMTVVHYGDVPLQTYLVRQ